MGSAERDGCGVPGMCEPTHPPVRAVRLDCAVWLSGVGGGRRSCLSSSLVVVSCTLFVASGVSLRGGRILSSVSHIAFRAVDSGMKVQKGLEPVMPCTRFTHARSFSRTTLWSSLFHEKIVWICLIHWLMRYMSSARQMSISAALSTTAVSLSPMWKPVRESYSFLNASTFVLKSFLIFRRSLSRATSSPPKMVEVREAWDVLENRDSLPSLEPCSCRSES